MKKEINTQTVKSELPYYKVLKNEITKGEFEATIDHDRKAGNYPKTLISCNGNLVAYCYKRNFDIDQVTAEANAQYTALAVNNLAKLADALQECLNNPDRISKAAIAYSISLSHPITNTVKIEADWYAKIREALNNIS